MHEEQHDFLLLVYASWGLLDIIRHRAGACEGARAFLRCWVSGLSPSSPSASLPLVKGTPPPRSQRAGHLFRPKTDPKIRHLPGSPKSPFVEAPGLHLGSQNGQNSPPMAGFSWQRANVLPTHYLLCRTHIGPLLFRTFFVQKSLSDALCNLL